MAILIDASVLIAAERGALSLKDLLEHAAEEVALAAITASELLHGVHRVTGARRASREAFVERLLAQVAIVPFDLVCARVHARLWADLSARGISAGAHDLLIAATAVATRAKVATRDKRSFPRIPGLTVLQW